MRILEFTVIIKPLTVVAHLMSVTFACGLTMHLTGRKINRAFCYTTSLLFRITVRVCGCFMLYYDASWIRFFFYIMVFTSEITVYVLRIMCVLQEWSVRELCNLISLHGLCANKSDFYLPFMLSITYQHFLLKIYWRKFDYVPKSTFINLGLERCFNAFERNILCSPSLHLFDQTWS